MTIPVILFLAVIFFALIVIRIGVANKGLRLALSLATTGLITLFFVRSSLSHDSMVPSPDADIARGDRIDRSALFGETCKGHTMSLAVIGAHWCGACQAMDKDTFSNPAVKEAIKNDGFVYVHEENAPGVAQRLRVEGYPTTIVLDGKCREAHRIRGYRDADEFLQELRAVRGTL